MSKYGKYIIIMVLMLCMAATVTAQQTTDDSVELGECPELEHPPADFQTEIPNSHEGILGAVTVVGNDKDGPFRGLGGGTGLRDYKAEMPVIVDHNGNTVDDESFVGFVLDSEGRVINEPDYGGAKGFFITRAFRAVAPDGVWFIIEDKNPDKVENLPSTARIVVPGDVICFNEEGGHGWAYSGPYPHQIVIELGEWFGPFSDAELAAEQRRIEWRLEVVDSVLTMTQDPSAYDNLDDDDEVDAEG